MYGGDAAIGGGYVPGGILIVPGRFGTSESVHPTHVHGEALGVFGENATLYGHLLPAGVALAVAGDEGDGKGAGIAFVIEAVHGPECIPESYFGWFCFHGGQDSGRMVWGLGRVKGGLILKS